MHSVTGADASGAQCRQKPVLAMIFLENTRDFPEIMTSTGAKYFRVISALQYCTGNFSGFVF